MQFPFNTTTFQIYVIIFGLTRIGIDHPWQQLSSVGQAKPRQSVNLGWRLALVNVPRLLAIPAFDHIAGLCNTPKL